MDVEEEWREWIRFSRPLAPDAAEMALLAVSASLADASEEVVVPFMTRCRAFSVILGVIAEYRQHGLQSPKVRRFFDTAPRDVRAAFYDLLVRAM